MHAPALGVTTAVLADVTGHGVAAALVTAVLHGFFSATEQEIARLAPGEWSTGMNTVLRRLNGTVMRSTRKSLACSLFLMTLEHETLKLRYVSAGHTPPLLVREVNKVKQVLAEEVAPSSLIGDEDEPEFAFGEQQLRRGDLILLYTDGLVECTNGTNEKYGFGRLRTALLRIAAFDARLACETLMHDARSFYGDRPPADDISMILGRAN
jgi:sigma-B regulation protein RsbU (phosphoserine phosphatase)